MYQELRQQQEGGFGEEIEIIVNEVVNPSPSPPPPQPPQHEIEEEDEIDQYNIDSAWHIAGTIFCIMNFIIVTIRALA